jgi:hypothetical protein
MSNEKITKPRRGKIVEGEASSRFWWCGAARFDVQG